MLDGLDLRDFQSFWFRRACHDTIKRASQIRLAVCNVNSRDTALNEV